MAPAGHALDAARELANEILEGSPTSVRLSLTKMNEADGIADTVDAVTAPTDVLDQLLTSADTIERVMAFVTKRKPEWKNR